MFRILVRSRLRSLLIFALLATTETAISQEDDILSRIYGEGVHAYNRGDYRRAHERLTTTIESGNRDPRAYYFRGLTYQKLARPEQASRDFAEAANLEVRDGNLADPVSRALTRVQGPDRLEIESFRSEARRKLNRRRVRMDQDRFTPPGQERRNPDPVAEPVETLPEKSGGEGEAATKKFDQAQPETSSDGDDLFGDDNEATQEDTSTDDPFAEDTSEDSKEPQEEEEESDEDPFG